MSLITECSNKHLYPWMHYTISNYFNNDVLNSVLELFENLLFVQSRDEFRKECNLSYELNNSVVDKILDNFLQKENINFLSSLDSRIKDNQKLLRVSLWKDYNGFHLPIHTDSHYKLFTMQIYLPRNNEEGYGTTIYDQDGKFVKKLTYKLNNGYFFFPNINKVKTNHSFVDAITTERSSLIFNVFNKNFFNKKGLIDCDLNQKFPSCIEF